MRSILLVVILGSLFGCATVTQLPAQHAIVSEQSLKADRYHVRIPSHDGTRLAATVYQPELAAGQSAPLIIATHGFGGFRAKRPFSIYGRSMLSGQAALAAWDAGYWVIFYDQRGWGQSQGKVKMMDPDYEVADLSAVIDWSLAHLPGIRRQPDGQPAIGMIGESYGAGVQTLASFHDPRLQAIVPIAGWHDLNTLAPNGEFRSAWGAILVSAGGISSGFDTGEMFVRPWRSAFTGRPNSDAQALMHRRSPAWYCQQGLAPQSDALFIQSFSDTLMPLQEGLDNLDCWQQQGRDGRLIGLQSGHVLPWPLQRWRGWLPFFQSDDAVFCGDDYQGSTVDTILTWWDEKLRDGEQQVPPLCLNASEQRGLALERMPSHRQSFELPPSKVTLPLAGAFEWLMVPVDHSTDLIRRALWRGTDLRSDQGQGGFGRPRFVPLYRVQGDEEWLLGTPQIELDLGGITSKQRVPVFVGVGIQGANQRRVRVASEQLTPLPSKGRKRQALPIISEPLQAGDRIGLVMYGFNSQFFINGAWLPRVATLRGRVDLPLTDEQRLGLPSQRFQPR